MEQPIHPRTWASTCLRVLVWLAAALPLQAQADTALRLEPGQGQWPLAAHTRYLHDASGQIDAGQAWQRFQAGHGVSADAFESGGQ